MKKIVCEMCNASDFVKQDGLFVCQCCGMKYTLEETRKMMVEGVVEVRGTVKLDQSDELQRLYQAARNARETSDDESALRHYERISAIDPDNWEALFYLVVLKTNSIKNSEIKSSAVSVSSCLPKVFSLIKETVEGEDQKKAAIDEVISQCHTTATWLTSASHSFYKTMTQGNGLMALTGIFGAISSAGSSLTELGEDSERCVAIANIMCYCGNLIEENFDMQDQDYCQFAVWCWTKMLEFHTDYHNVHSTQTLFDEASVTRFTNKINQYSPKAFVDTNVVMLTLCFDSNAGSVGELVYSIDGSGRYSLMRRGRQQHLLERGSHTLSILNPFMKKDVPFLLENDLTLNVYGKSFGMDVY